MADMEDCLRCLRPWLLHTEGVFNAACSRDDCDCLFYWDSEDDALVHADERLAKREREEESNNVD